ncbi:MAG: hypothetical protein RL308_2647 [Bacteroidota bacterium]|jgi:hypothetical protein
MTKDNFFNSNYFKILFPIFLAAMAIALWRRGYEFGQLFYAYLN